MRVCSGTTRQNEDERMSDATAATLSPNAVNGRPTPDADPEAGARPTALLPMTQLLRISLY